MQRQREEMLKLSFLLGVFRVFSIVLFTTSFSQYNIYVFIVSASAASLLLAQLLIATFDNTPIAIDSQLF